MKVKVRIEMQECVPHFLLISDLLRSEVMMTMVIRRPSSSSYTKYKRTLKAPGVAVRINALRISPEQVEKHVSREKSQISLEKG